MVWVHNPLQIVKSSTQKKSRKKTEQERNIPLSCSKVQIVPNGAKSFKKSPLNLQICFRMNLLIMDGSTFLKVKTYTDWKFKIISWNILLIRIQMQLDTKFNLIVYWPLRSVDLSGFNMFAMRKSRLNLKCKKQTKLEQKSLM